MKRYIITLLLIGFAVFSVQCQSITPTNKNQIEKNISDFDVKGFHLDLRIQVMTPEALKNFATELANFGINTIIMEWEATYPYEKHATISNSLSYTRDEVEDFIEHCDSLGIDVIPLQQTFGHLEYVLRHDRYSGLKEDRKEISQVCPLETDLNQALFKGLLSDMAKIHHSKYLHIGGDETYLLGHCEKCAAKVEKEGKSKLFVDHMKMIAEETIALGKTPVMWADMILKHPEAADELPKEVIFVDWNYGWRNDLFGDVQVLKDKGFTFWGSPAIRSHPDNWFATNWAIHLDNQRDFIPYARKEGYKGMVMTSWSTGGLYGFTWDVGFDVIDMVQIRNTYPLSGFRILIDLYSKALKSKTPIDPQIEVKKYAKERFGFTEDEAQKFWEVLITPEELIVNGKPQNSNSIKDMILEAEKNQTLLYQLKAIKNKKELEHFKFMADLRVFYLKFKEVSAEFNSDGFKLGDGNSLITTLKEQLKEADTLDKRFSDLQKGFLYPSEIEQQNYLRRLQIIRLYERLAKLK